MKWFYNTILVIIKPLFHLLFWYKAEGRENVTKEGGYILCCNHVSIIDPIFLAYISPVPVRFMAKDELFKNKFLAWFFKSLLTIHVKRGTGDTTAVKQSVETIKNGDVLGIFPEGTRSKDGKMLRAKSGISLIAGKTGADILPCAIICRGKMRPFKKIRVVVGKKIDASEIVMDESNQRSELKRVSELVMSRIAELMDKDKF